MLLQQNRAPLTSQHRKRLLDAFADCIPPFPALVLAGEQPQLSSGRCPVEPVGFVIRFSTTHFSNAVFLTQAAQQQSTSYAVQVKSLSLSRSFFLNIHFKVLDYF